MGGRLALTGKPPEGALGARCLLLLLPLLLSLPTYILCRQGPQDAAEGAITRATSTDEAKTEAAAAVATAAAAAPTGAERTPNAQISTNNVSGHKSSNSNRRSSSKNNNNNDSNSSSSSSDRFAEAGLPLGFREPLSLLPQKSEAVFNKLAACADTDPRCQYELAIFYFLGRPPLPARNLQATLQLLWLSARGGSADAQYLLGILHQNLYLLPKEPPLIELDTPLRVVVRRDYELSFFAGDRPIPAPWGPLKALKVFELRLHSTADAEGLGVSKMWQKLQSHVSWALAGGPWAHRNQEGPLDEGPPEEEPPEEGPPGEGPPEEGPPEEEPSEEGPSEEGPKTEEAETAGSGAPEKESAPKTVAQAMQLLLSAPDFAFNPPLPLVYLYAAATAMHPAAAAAVAWKQQFAALDGSVGQQQQACAAAANNYLPVAKATAGLYALGIPQAIEVLRLATGNAPLQGSDIQRLSTDPEQLAMLLHEAEEGNLAVHAALGRKYLFGVDGFPQNFAKARYHLLAASKSWKGESKGLLGYMYALGLGVEQDMNEAAEWFFRGATENEDPIAYNGLGLVYFFGTPLIEASPAMAFEMFNRSATLNSPDGQLNLASLYLTGTGVSKSFVEALKWLTKAVRGGSTGAAYALGTMHLSGLGAVRDCPLAVGLLKLAAERAPYFAHALQRAHSAYEQNAFDEAAFNFLLLAEAGHEASQSNLAFLLDAGLTDIFFDGTLRRKRLHAQRFYEMAAAQGALSAQLRLGDFAYYGYGVRRRSSSMKYTRDFVDEKGTSFDGWLSQPKFWLEEGVKDFAEAAAFYRKVADSASWGPALAAKARYNLGAMHLFGIGVPQDLYLASHHFKRQAFFARLRQKDGWPRILNEPRSRRACAYCSGVLQSLLVEPRVLFLILNFVAMVVLLILRAVLQALRRERGLTDRAFIAAARRGPGQAAQARQQQQQQERQQPQEQTQLQQPQQQQQQPAAPQQKQQQQPATQQQQQQQQQQPSVQQEHSPPSSQKTPHCDAEQEAQQLKPQGQPAEKEGSNQGGKAEASPPLGVAAVPSNNNVDSSSSSSSSSNTSSNAASSSLTGAVNTSLDVNRFAVKGGSEGNSSSNNNSSNNSSSGGNSNSSSNETSDSKKLTETPSGDGLNSSGPCPQADETARAEPNALWLQRDWAPPPSL
ncbi:hypothetical protein, conserved [Eimeria brunetti]|uniref:Sel1 repeat-containing protein n=1 Tax=Eimeria brunetti TaxID=51314 RepID=U6L9B3_9EIME|nr:hypothetical protein, conserved [Eimeria brunetti]